MREEAGNDKKNTRSSVRCRNKPQDIGVVTDHQEMISSEEAGCQRGLSKNKNGKKCAEKLHRYTMFGDT
jgi:hypothetical protein